MASFAETKTAALEALGFFWNKVFLDTDFVDGYSTSVAVELQSLDEFVDRLPDYLARRKTPTKELSRHRLFIFNEGDASLLKIKFGDEGLVYGGGEFYGDNTGIPTHVYPIDPGFSTEFFALGITEPDTVLRKGVDYDVINDNVHFFEDPLLIPGLVKTTTLDTNGDPVFQFLLFGFEVEEDIEAACLYFGTMAGVCGTSSPTLTDAVNLAWDLRVDGATVRHLHRMLALLTDTTYLDQPGIIQDIFEEGDRRVVLTEDAVYTAPLSSTVLKSVGEPVQEGDFLFSTYLVKGGTELIDFEDFEALTLGPGFVSDISPQGLLFENNLVDVTRESHPDFVTVVPD